MDFKRGLPSLALVMQLAACGKVNGPADAKAPEARGSATPIEAQSGKTILEDSAGPDVPDLHGADSSGADSADAKVSVSVEHVGTVDVSGGFPGSMD